MWKRLSRLWKKSDPDARGLEQEMRLSASRVEPAAQYDAELSAAPVEADPLIAALEHFDLEHREAGAEGVVGRMRELMVLAPTDPRVLRRAAELARELGDEGLAHELEQGATSSSGAPLAELGHTFLAMDDAELALSLGDGAMARAHERAKKMRRRAEGVAEGDDDGLAAGRLVGALALSRLGEHAQVMARLEHALDEGIAARVRWALSAIALGDEAAQGLVAGRLGPAERWVDEVRARVAAFPSAREGFSSDPQRLLFALYGSVLLDDAEHGERLAAPRILRWILALAELVKDVLPAGTRPTWVSPRGEVLARWLARHLPEEAAMPLSARLPRQPVLVVLADDGDLATLVETRAWSEGPLPIFQALKDPREVGSPIADVIGVFKEDVSLPFEELEAERAQDRVPPRVLAGRLGDEVRGSEVDPEELAGFFGWVAARREHLTLLAPPPGEERIPLDVARDI